MEKGKSQSKPNRIEVKDPLVLLIIDMLNTFDFPEGKALAQNSLEIAKNIQVLKKKLKEQSVPVIYLNDNFGKWRSDHKEVYKLCTQEGCLGKDIAEHLEPEKDDFFILKPRHSGFYSTNLDVLLKDLGTEKMIITGVAGNICVLFTANDAHMRDYQIWIPEDCIASNTKKDNSFALEQLQNVLKISIQNSKEGLSTFLESQNKGDIMERQYSESASKDVESAMKRRKKGTLRSGPGGKGGKVTSKKQAVAIGLSEARAKGKKVPKKKASKSGQASKSMTH